MNETKQAQAASQPEQKLAKITFPSMLERYKGQIALALPRHMSADRMCRIALTEFRKNPKLAQCDPRSIYAACIVASQLGLEPGVLGQCYLIPFGNECQLIIGYQGLLDLVRRQGDVKRIEAHIVREGDKFTYKTGLVTVLDHEPVLEWKNGVGVLRFAYAVAEFRDGGYHVEVMSRDQIEAIRDRSQGYTTAKKYNRQTPWETDEAEMWRKTVLRRICKFLPKSPELATALQLDNAADVGEQKISTEDAIAGTWAPVLSVETVGDENLARKSAENLQDIKEHYAAKNEPPPISETDPAYAEKLRAEAERQKQMVADQLEKERQEYGASQQSTTVTTTPEPESESTAPAEAADNNTAPQPTEETAQPEPAPLPQENLALMSEANPFDAPKKRRK